MTRQIALVLGFAALTAVSTQSVGLIPKASLVKPAHADQAIDFKRSINLAGAQRMLSQRMAKELVLVAMGYEEQENLNNLRASAARFERVLEGLRNGDNELGLTQFDHEAVNKNLARVEEIWPLFDVVLEDSLASGQVSRDTVTLMSDLNLRLLTAMHDTVNAYEDASREGALFSMLEMIINISGQQRMLSQKMTKEFLLIRYNENPELNRIRLAETMQLFEKSLSGLMDGDPELRLIPVPETHIRNQLKTVELLWQKFKPMMQAAVDGQPIDDGLLDNVVNLNLTLLAEMHATVDMYEAL